MLQDRLMSFALLGAEWVMWLLIGLSLLCIAVAVERAIYIALNSSPTAALQEALDRFLNGGSAADLSETLSDMRGLQARVLRAGLEAGQRDGSAAAEEVITGYLTYEKLQLSRRLLVIGTTGSNAPFLGLFGTVLGIIKAFNDLASDSAEASTAVMAGISEALVATAVGLMVAIPAVVLYNYFQGRNKAIVAELESMSHLVLSRFKAPAKIAEGA
jgi:biopolymer transport protein ExbB